MDKIRTALNRIYNDKKEIGAISQSMIAKHLRCGQGTVSLYLSGARSMSDKIIEAFCDALGVTLADLEQWNPELAKIRFPSNKDAAADTYTCSNKSHIKYHKMLDVILDGKKKQWKVGIISNLRGMSFSAAADSAGRFPKGDNILFIPGPLPLPGDEVEFDDTEILQKGLKKSRK
jgi:hypothetical protein